MLVLTMWVALMIYAWPSPGAFFMLGTLFGFLMAAVRVVQSGWEPPR